MSVQNRRLIAKGANGIDTTDLANGGKLDSQRANKFIDYMVDSSVLLKNIEVIRMTSDTYQLDTIGVAGRIVRKATENVAPTEIAGVSTGKRTMQVTEVILPFDIGYRFLEDNIEKGGAEDHVARLFAQQFANDVEDLGINGDTADVSADADFLTIDNGWVKIAKTEAAFNKYDTAASTDYKGAVFPGMLRAMPEKWKRRRDLVFLVSPQVEEDYRLSLANRETVLGDQQLTEGTVQKFAGYNVIAVPFLPTGTHLLTPWKNLAFGIHEREILVEKQRQTRKRVIEYTTTARIDYNWVNPEAAVVGYDVTPGA